MKKHLSIIALIVVLDQILKYFIDNKIKNYGASFNILENSPYILLLASVLALVVFIYWFVKNKPHRLALSFLMAGTLSNLIDRIFLGYIIDYINLPYLFAFNLADLSNTVGIIILIIKMYKEK